MVIKTVSILKTRSRSKAQRHQAYVRRAVLKDAGLRQNMKRVGHPLVLSSRQRGEQDRHPLTRALCNRSALRQGGRMCSVSED